MRACKPRHFSPRTASDQLGEATTTMPLLEGLVNGVNGEGGLPALLLDNLFVTVPVLLTLAVLFFLRPRKAGSKYKDAPPMVTKSTVSSVPLLGPAIEFGKSPVKMVKRCYDDYGPVFTVPVRAAADLCHVLGSRMRCICFVLLFAPGPVEHCSFAFDILSGTDICRFAFTSPPACIGRTSSSYFKWDACLP